MEERIMKWNRGVFVETEHSVERNTIYFSVLDQDVDSVEWKIGTDPKIYNGKNFELFFKEPFGEIEIRCIAYKQSVSSCLGETAIIDTMYKTLHIHEWWDVPYLGNFEGESNQNPRISFNTNIDTLTYYDGIGMVNQRAPVAFLENFPNNYQMPIPPDGLNIPNRPYTQYFYNGFILTNAGELGSSIAVFDIKSKKINIEYGFLVNNNWEIYLYSGLKIN
ncbi:MAG: hypothetical protein ACPGVC_10380 [Salibacteraceae bacterium]